VNIQYLKNIKYQSVGLAIAQLINTLALPVLTRYYGPEQMGLYSMFVQALGFATILLSFRAEHLIMIRAGQRQSNKFCLHILLIASFLCVIQAAVVLVTFVSGVIPLEKFVWVILLPPAAYALVSSYALQQLVQKAGGFRRSAISEVVPKLVTAAASVCGAVFHMSAVVLPISLMLGYLAKIFFYRDRISLLHRCFRRSENSWPAWTDLWRVRSSLASLSGSHILLFGTSILPLIYIENTYGMRQVGLYSLVISTLYFPTSLFGAALGSVYYQSASRSHAKGAGFSELFWTNIRYLSGAATLIYGVIAIFSPYIYQLLFGAQWEEAGHIARVYCFAAALAFITVPLDRSGLVVNAWWYGVSWHTLRLISTLGVVAWSKLNGLSFDDFFLCITIQTAVMHTIDGIASYYFACGYRLRQEHANQ
jgi:O-antigen/teichoic acid export membrane protein